MFAGWKPALRPVSEAYVAPGVTRNSHGFIGALCQVSTRFPALSWDRLKLSTPLKFSSTKMSSPALTLPRRFFNGQWTFGCLGAGSSARHAFPLVMVRPVNCRLPGSRREGEAQSPGP